MRTKSSYTSITLRIDNDNIQGSKAALTMFSELFGSNLPASDAKTDLSSSELAAIKKDAVIEFADYLKKAINKQTPITHDVLHEIALAWQ